MGRAVLLLGAGASMEFLPRVRGELLTTQSLTRFVRDDLINLPATGLPQDFKEIMFNAVSALRRYIRTKGIEAYHFEHIIHLLDKYCGICGEKAQWLTSSTLDYYDNTDLNLALIQMVDGNVFSQRYSGIARYPILIRNLLLWHIASNYSAAPSDSGIELWSAFLKKIRARQPISIYTVNYDNVIVEAVRKSALPIETGFDSATGEFQPRKFYDAQDCLSFLHGSVFFGPGSLGRCRVRWYGQLQDAKQAREATQSIPRNQANERIYNTFMTTGLDKFYTMAEEPYSTYYRRFMRDMDEAKTIYVIGYGGADIHLNLLLESSLNSNKKFKVVGFRSESQRVGRIDWEIPGDVSDSIAKYLPIDILQTLKDKEFRKRIYAPGVQWHLAGTKDFLEYSVR